MLHPGEPNQVLWRGVRPITGIRGVWPGIDAERIVKSKYLSGAGPAIVYTVPADTRLYLTSAFASVRFDGAGPSWAAIGVRDGGDAHLYWLAMIYVVDASFYNTPLSYFPALEMTAGYDVYVKTGSANADINGIINGWLEDI